MTIQLFMDDSGEATDPNELSVAVAGNLAPAENWQAFQSEWTSVLREYGVKVFHMKDLQAYQKEFDSWKRKGPQYREDFVDRLLETMRRNDLQPVGAAMPLVLHAGLSASQRETLLGHGYYSVLHAVFQVAATAAMPYDEEVLDVILAEKKKFIGKAQAVFQRIREAHAYGLKLASLDPYGNPNTFVQLQAADLVAWEMTRFYREPGRSALHKVEEIGTAGYLVWLRPSDLQEWFDEGEE
jgi:hypothetical protein